MKAGPVLALCVSLPLSGAAVGFSIYGYIIEPSPLYSHDDAQCV